eukprot:TRINITY_DN18926_c0_g1_i1.p1 TRINITY_DN18926_c0_g1~~TRINITY_DN18926_c0_g1_i1.p1  ORF type:complete len:256 (-),score=46.69 TRINITY_DN18926_c0_g1_i1:687-1379(-)
MAPSFYHGEVVADETPEEPILLSNLLDMLLRVLAQGKLQLALECVELLARDASSAYVAGLGKEEWMAVKFQTAVGSRRLPRESTLVYGAFDHASAFDDVDECFLLAGLLDIIHSVLRRRDLDLALNLLENVSASALFAIVMNLPSEAWRNLKVHLADDNGNRPLEAVVSSPPPFRLTTLRRRTTAWQDEDDDGEAAIGKSMFCAMGLDRVPLHNISLRCLPDAASYVMSA